ncbi:unnamed protein product, partial [Laminaria digitata]
DRLREIRSENQPEMDDPEAFEADEGVDWMDAAAMGRGRQNGGDHGHDDTWDEDHDCAEARGRFSPEDLSTGNTFVEVQRKQAGGAPPDERGVPVVLPTQLNERQRVAYDIVRAHLDGDAEREPLRMMVLGTAGTGKSWLVNALSHLLGPRVRCAAPTGIAAFVIGGSTLHSLLKLPIRGGRLLQGESLNKIQISLRGVQYLVIDELSMVSQAQFAWVGRRLRQATGKTEELFGGMSVIMTGDPGQLPPVGGRALHAKDPRDQLNQEGFQAYRSFRNVVILEKVQRQ